jgi:hypothetical protein
VPDEQFSYQDVNCSEEIKFRTGIIVVLFILAPVYNVARYHFSYTIPFTKVSV